MKEVHEAFDEARKCALPVVKTMVTNSFMNWVLVQIMMNYAAANHFADTSENMLQLARHMFDPCFGASAIVEDLFQRERDKEAREQMDTRFRAGRVWFCGVQRQVLTQVHKWQEVDYRAQPRSHPTSKMRLPQSLHLPRASQVQGVCWKALVTKEKPSWPSWTAQSGQVLFPEMALMLQCKKENDWQRASTAWLSILLEPGTIVQDPRSHKWFLSLGHVSAKAAMAWPLELHCIRTKRAFRLCTTTTLQDLHWLLVTNIDEWQAWDHDWCSPVGLAARVAHKGALQEGLLCMVRGEPKPLLRLAAEKAFWRLPFIPIRKLCQHFAVQAEDGQDLFSCLLALMSLCLPEASEEKLLDLLEARLVNPHFTSSEFLTDPVLSDVFDDDDNKLLQSFFDEEKAKKQVATDFHTHFLEKRGAGKNRKPRGKTVKWPANLTRDFAKSHAPPGGQIQKDTFNNSWQGSYQPYGTFSRSWPLYGEKESLKQVLTQLWIWHKRSKGEDCPYLDMREEVEGA